jgi:CRISPR-associated protein Csd1
MILQALIEYAERSGAQSPDFSTVGVRWLVNLDGKGAYLGLIELFEDPTAKKLRPKRLVRPFTSPNQISSGKQSHFLCDTLERALGWAEKDAVVKESRQGQHLYFKALLTEAAQTCPDAKVSLTAITSFLADVSAKGRLFADLVSHKAKGIDNATFQVAGRNILDEPDIKLFWAKKRAGSTETRHQAVCLATGKLTGVLNTHEKIRRVPGTMSIGANLISADKDAFCHFGLEQAQNAPLSPEAEFKIRTALEQLIEKSYEQHLDIDGSIFLHWTRQPIEFDPFDLIAAQDPEAIERLLHAPAKGTDVMGVDSNAYYLLSLSGNGARIAIRGWLATTVPVIQQNIRRWFTDLSVIKPDGLMAQNGFSLFFLLRSLVREKIRELPPQLPADLIKAALEGLPLPQTILAAALRRQNVDIKDRTNPNRIALIKACLVRNSQNTNEHMTEALNLESTDRAYLCGRLLAIFDRLQYLALGDVNAGIVERYYPSASSTPAIVMGRLFRNAQFHLAKANGGVSENVRKEIEAITTALGNEFPPSLSLEEQGRFALGFYHQKAEFRRRTAERREEAKNGTVEGK